MSLRARKTMVQVFRYTIAVVALVFFLFPIMWIALTPFKTPEEFLRNPPVWIPHTPGFGYFAHVVRTGGPKALTNSLIISLSATLLAAVWMMRGFFLEIPVEIEESALVDGCSPFGAFWHIALPLVTPGLVATGVFCFIFSWAEFFFAVTLTRSNAVTLSVYIVNFFGKMMVQWGEVGATSLVAMLPLFLLSFVVQRYLVRGLTLGAVK